MDEYTCMIHDLELLLEELDKKKDDCIYNSEELSNQIWILEDQISELRIQLNELNETSSKLKADEAALNAKIQLYEADISSKNREIDELNKEIAKQRKDQEISDILKWIPIVNIGAVIYDLIAQDEEKIQQLQKEVNTINKTINDLKQELDELMKQEEQIKSEIASIEKSMHDLELLLVSEKEKLQESKEEEVAYLTQIYKIQELLSMLYNYESGILTRDDLVSYLKEKGYIIEE